MIIPEETMKSRKEIAIDLKKLQDILYDYFPTAETSSIESAKSELRNPKRAPQIPDLQTDANFWGYTISRMIFNFENTPRHTIPTDCINLKLILDITVIGNCEDINTLKDPFKWLEFNITIEGTKFVDKESIQMITSYHLDRHIQCENDGDSNYPHPLYHFQFGGRKLKNFHNPFNTGDLLVIDSPRIPHYPMEAILGIDFILSNFFPKVWKKMKIESSEYINLVEKYQNLFLKPYVHTYASHWFYSSGNLEIDSLWNPNTICPQL